MSDFQFSPISTKTIKIEGMTCGHCKTKVENILKGYENISEAEVDLIDASVEVSFTDDLDFDQISDKIHYAGFKVVSIE